MSDPVKTVRWSRGMNKFPCITCRKVISVHGWYPIFLVGSKSFVYCKDCETAVTLLNAMEPK